MAPRADAPIFRLRPQAAPQQPGAGADQPAPRVYAEATAPVAAQPGQQGSRYYSVHREAGHAPDRTALPEAVFYDSVALDLAQPMLRDLQAAVPMVATSTRISHALRRHDLSSQIFNSHVPQLRLQSPKLQRFHSRLLGCHRHLIDLSTIQVRASGA
jgi:hypothetical protein